MNADPVAFWQSRQWQTRIPNGLLVEISYRLAVHRHPPVYVLAFGGEVIKNQEDSERRARRVVVGYETWMDDPLLYFFNFASEPIMFQRDAELCLA